MHAADAAATDADAAVVQEDAIDVNAVPPVVPPVDGQMPAAGQHVLVIPLGLKSP